MEKLQKQLKNVSDVCACINMRRASRAITKIYDNALGPSGLKASQLSLLLNIKANGPVIVSDLARVTNLERTTLVRNLKPMEIRGFIERLPSSDSRERPLQLTKEGAQAVKKALAHWNCVQSSIKKQLGDEQMQAIMHLADSLESFAGET